MAPHRSSSLPEPRDQHASPAATRRRVPLWWRRLRKRVPGLRVLVQAVRNYIAHQSANQAGSVAFSAVLALFPLVLLVSAAASFIGKPGSAAELVGRVVGYAPPLVGESLRAVIDQLLAHPSPRLLVAGALVTVWTASSGTQAIRTALNRAYGVRSSLSFWRARIKVTLFTVLGTLSAVLVFSSVVVLPYAWALLERTLGVGPEAPWLRNSVRYSAAFVVLVVVYALFYAWLPDVRQRTRTVLPGAAVGALLWIGAAAALSGVLRSAGQLALVYGGFAGLIATLGFLYVSAVTLIYGAEVNAVLADDEGLRAPNPAAVDRR